MRVIRTLAVLIATVTLTACLNSTTIVKVKPDGSGTVEQTTLVNTAALKGVVGNEPGKQVGGPVINREDLERTAERMGKGVTLVSAEPFKGENGFEGTKAIFAFEDINLIQISQDPNIHPNAQSPRVGGPGRRAFPDSRGAAQTASGIRIPERVHSRHAGSVSRTRGVGQIRHMRRHIHGRGQ